MKGEVDPNLMGRLQSSIEDRNWDSIEAFWRIKEEVKNDPELTQAFKGEILVCRMTNPAWVVLFTKIVGLVTDAGGVTSHPAVVSREFSIPAVVGTSNSTERIKTGDRIRVNGSTGVVEVLS